jgi:hypothetical protein
MIERTMHTRGWRTAALIAIYLTLLMASVVAVVAGLAELLL